MGNQAVKAVDIRRFKGDSADDAPDFLAVEEPLEIRLEYGPAGRRITKNLSVTMRTPGADDDLAAGFLFTEGIVQQATDIAGIRGFENTITVALSPDLAVDLQKLERHFYTTSSCGVCGKTSIDAVKTAVNCVPVAPTNDWVLDPEIIYALPDALRRAQDTFDTTGGLHASALFDRSGQLLAVREDVGRHNALDKLIGHYFRQGAVPLDDHILLLSGRASFELLQKSAMAGIRVVCAVGAPSSLAVETAEAFGIMLIGFLRDNRFNVYSKLEQFDSVRAS